MSDVDIFHAPRDFEFHDFDTRNVTASDGGTATLRFPRLDADAVHALAASVLKVRSAIVPVANLGSQLFWPLFLIGLIFSLPMLVKAGIWLFVLALAFQVVTLPVEFDASRRALKMLGADGMITETEHDGVKKVLWAAAMTYVAAVIGSLLQLLRLLVLSGAFRRNDD